MVGGPGGTGAGIQSESILWTIIMSAFAGASSCQLVSYLADQLWRFSRVWWYPIRVCQSQGYFTRSQSLNYTLWE